MKSHSVSGPIGCPQPSFIPSSMSSRAAKPVLVHPHRGHQVRDEQHVHDEARAVLGADRVLADRAGESLRALRRSRRTCRARRRPRRASSPAPARRSAGRAPGPGAWSTRRAARSGSTTCSTRGCVLGRASSSRRLEQLALDRRVLDDRLDRRARRRASASRSVSTTRSAVERRRGVVVELAARRPPWRPSASIRLARALRAARPRARGRRRRARRERRLGDARAHEPRADDAEPGDGGFGLSPDRLIVDRCRRPRSRAGRARACRRCRRSAAGWLLGGLGRLGRRAAAVAADGGGAAQRVHELGRGAGLGLRVIEGEVQVVAAAVAGVAVVADPAEGRTGLVLLRLGPRGQAIDVVPGAALGPVGDDVERQPERVLAVRGSARRPSSSRR